MTTNTKKHILLAGVLGTAGLLSPAADAQVNITSPNPALFSTSIGQTLSLSATLQNVFSTQVFFTGDNIAFVGAQPGLVEIGTPTSSSTVAVDDTPFAGTPSSPRFPAPLAASEQRAVPLANLFIGANAAPGTYNGYFTLQGGATMTSTGDLATQNFRIVVNAAPVPEASTLLSLGLLAGAFTLGVARSRRRGRENAQADSAAVLVHFTCEHQLTNRLNKP